MAITIMPQVTPMDEFIWRALLGGIGVAIVAGPVGCFIVWRRMAFFGHAVSHASLLGIAAGLALGTNVTFGIVATGMALALTLVGLETRRLLATDTLIGILGHATLAGGLVALSFMPSVRMDLMGYLFGDVLAIDRMDVALIWIVGALVLATLAYIWRPLLSLTVHEDLARVEGTPTLAIRIVYMLIVTLVIALGMQIVGILMIISLLIIPAAAARPFATSTAGMAISATGIGILSVLGGTAASFSWDTPTGPSIVLVASAIFAVTFLGARALGR